MVIIEDTRQKSGQHNKKHLHFDAMGVQMLRNSLPFGDYCYPPSISVDTKENIDEIAQNLTGEHERFRHECERAQQADCHLYILIETEWPIRSVEDMPKWMNPRSPISRKAVTGERLKKIMETMSHRYGVTFMFCHPDNAAEMILRILNGEFEDEQGNNGGGS